MQLHGWSKTDILYYSTIDTESEWMLVYRIVVIEWMKWVNVKNMLYLAVFSVYILCCLSPLYTGMGTHDMFDSTVHMWIVVSCPCRPTFNPLRRGLGMRLMKGSSEWSTLHYGKMSCGTDVTAFLHGPQPRFYLAATNKIRKPSSLVSKIRSATWCDSDWHSHATHA